ncbi:HMG domain-containing protein 3-like [Dendronephthya gigantea]|uniref:HMG domain-containing protein 3-like n=1 Tax=Dendronephthya gigantea TaxID=151771 RepID=UPI00106CF05A|nr:HMG domain-containing protein 3-like [Dendronephthya gigantea]
MYCVFGKPTANNPVGYCHVRVTETTVRCCSKDCKMMIGKSKQLKSKCLCIHVHMLLCLGIVKKDSPAMGNANDEPTHNAVNAENEDHQQVSESLSRSNTIELNMKRSLPTPIPKEIICKPGVIDSSPAGWPEILEPSETLCGLCSSPLGEGKAHHGSRGKSYLLTELNPFKEIKVRVKMCTNTNCSAMNQIFPYELGLFNISDKILVPFQILLEWRELFRKGVPISIAIISKLNAMAERAAEPPERNVIENLANYIYNGYYCFEAITDRDLDSVVCGICGVIGNVYFGDGNEKNCCGIGQIDYTQPENVSESSPPTLEPFLNKIKRRWVESTSYTKTAEKFKVHVADIPPVIAPSMRGTRLYNTELQKNSTFLKENKSTKGDPALLHSIIREGKLDMTKLRELDETSLKSFCQDCRIPIGGKSMEKMRVALQTLYETLLVGSSPCHGFTKVPGQTGGFYHIVCRHGVTAASKFLTLQESVRDAADLYLSFKYPPLMFLCDTACGFARHMDCRVPEVANQLWGKFSGCFEEPTLGKPPAKDNSVPVLATAEYRSEATEATCYDDGTFKHPITGNARRYVLGDRFHNSANPHKSPLCDYHDINLLLQSNTIKTSYQECENNRKNIRRLRSSCVQEFGTHFFYNYLMDYFQNEDIVKKQRQLAAANLKPNQELKRDRFQRFVVINNE